MNRADCLRLGEPVGHNARPLAALPDWRCPDAVLLEKELPPTLAELFTPTIGEWWEAGAEGWDVVMVMVVMALTYGSKGQGLMTSNRWPPVVVSSTGLLMFASMVAWPFPVDLIAICSLYVLTGRYFEDYRKANGLPEDIGPWRRFRARAKVARWLLVRMSDAPLWARLVAMVVLVPFTILSGRVAVKVFGKLRAMGMPPKKK